MIARHFGHNNVQTPPCYAHLARESVKTADERVTVSFAPVYQAFRDYIQSHGTTET